MDWECQLTLPTNLHHPQPMSNKKTRTRVSLAAVVESLKAPILLRWMLEKQIVPQQLLALAVAELILVGLQIARSNPTQIETTLLPHGVIQRKARLGLLKMTKCLLYQVANV